MKTLILVSLLALSLAQGGLADGQQPSGASGQRPKFRIGVEAIIPGKEDWFATIYGTWFGKHFTEEQLGNALKEVGAEFTLL